MKSAKFIRCTLHLPVKNLRNSLDYYRELLGFSGEWTFGEKDGGISRDGMRLLFGEDPVYVSIMNSPSHRLPLLWFAENIEEIYAELKDRKIEIADELRTHPYGLREFAFVDINGYYARIAEAAENTEEKM
jgi:hypothetical protein